MTVSADEAIRDLVESCVNTLHQDYSDYVELYTQELGERVAAATWAGLALFANPAYPISLDKRQAFADKVKNKEYSSFTLNDCVKALHNCGYSMQMIVA
jgi:hypothetical protein